MAYIALSGPGTDHGPCREPCAHRDCDQTRELAERTACPGCSEPLGYDRTFWLVDGIMRHVACTEG